MKSQSTIQQQLRRFAAVLVVIAALTVVALAPALLASQLITPYGGKSTATGHIDHAATIDVTDIDENGTVMYTVSPPEGFRTDSRTDFKVPSDILNDADLIRVTVSDDDNTHTNLESETQKDCNFTLHLSKDDHYDAKTGSFTGYLRITDEETAKLEGSNFERLGHCGLYVTYAD